MHEVVVIMRFLIIFICTTLLIVSCKSIRDKDDCVNVPLSKDRIITSYVTNSVTVTEYDTGKDGLKNIKEFRTVGEKGEVSFIDKNSDGLVDLIVVYDEAGNNILITMSDTTGNGHYDTFVLPRRMRLKDLDDDGWPDQFWKGYAKPPEAKKH